MSTTYAIVTSTGAEVGNYGQLATYVTLDGESTSWTSETVQAPLDEDGRIVGDIERLLADQIEAAKAEVERRVGHPVEWTSVHEEAEFGGETVAVAEAAK